MLTSCLCPTDFMQTSQRDLVSWVQRSSSLYWTLPSCLRTPSHQGECKLVKTTLFFFFFNFFYFKISSTINFLSSVCSLQEQLRHLYPRLKVLAFGAKPESTLHTYLPSFLSRATSNCPADMKKEVREGLPKQPQSKSIITVFFVPLKLLSPYCVSQLLNSMTECLCVDAQSLGVWRQLYTKHLPQSR